MVMPVYSELLPLLNTLYAVNRQNNTLEVSHMNLFGSVMSDGVWTWYTMSDKDDPMLGDIVQWLDLWRLLNLFYYS